MRPELHYTNEEIRRIGEWKQFLPPNPDRIFAYMFIGTGKKDELGYSLHNYVIASNDGHKMTLVKNITL